MQLTFRVLKGLFELVSRNKALMGSIDKAVKTLEIDNF